MTSDLCDCEAPDLFHAMLILWINVSRLLLVIATPNFKLRISTKLLYDFYGFYAAGS